MATSSITLFNTPTHVDLYLSDLRLYMEACMAAEKSGITATLLEGFFLLTAVGGT